MFHCLTYTKYETNVIFFVSPPYRNDLFNYLTNWFYGLTNWSRCTYGTPRTRCTIEFAIPPRIFFLFYNFRLKFSFFPIRSPIVEVGPNSKCPCFACFRLGLFLSPKLRYQCIFLSPLLSSLCCYLSWCNYDTNPNFGFCRLNLVLCFNSSLPLMEGISLNFLISHLFLGYIFL